MYRLFIKEEKETKYEVKFFDKFYSLKVTKIGETITILRTYALIESTKGECIQNFINSGYREKLC